MPGAALGAVANSAAAAPRAGDLGDIASACRSAGGMKWDEIRLLCFGTVEQWMRCVFLYGVVLFWMVFWSVSGGNIPPRITRNSLTFECPEIGHLLNRACSTMSTSSNLFGRIKHASSDIRNCYTSSVGFLVPRLSKKMYQKGRSV